MLLVEMYLFLEIIFSARKKKKKKSCVVIFTVMYTVNPLHTDTRYNDEIHYNDNFTVTKPSRKR